MSKRKEATKFWIDLITKCQAGNANIEMYKTFLEGLTNNAFEALMLKVRDGEVVLPYYSANDGSKPLKVKTILDVGEGIGIKFFERLIVHDEVSGTEYMTPEYYMVVDIPGRRQMEMVSKKKSVATNSKLTDSISGQAIGISKAASISLPELMILDAQPKHDKLIEELISVRGGDVMAFRKARQDVIDTGEVSLDEIKKLGTRPRAIDSLSSYLKGMHLDEMSERDIAKIKSE